MDGRAKPLIVTSALCFKTFAPRISGVGGGGRYYRETGGDAFVRPAKEVASNIVRAFLHTVFVCTLAHYGASRGNNAVDNAAVFIPTRKQSF